MLPARERLRSSADFRDCLRGGVRVGRPTLVLHANLADPAGTACRVGFVVSKRVGNAVTRNRVKRRLRHLAVPLAAASPAGVDVVVRALPASVADAARLGVDLSSAWQRGLDLLTRRSAS